MNFCARFSGFLVIVLVLAGCGKVAPEVPIEPVALVEVQPASIGSVRETLSAYGTTEFNPAAADTLSVQVESQVAEIMVTVGSQVRRGQAILRLAPSASTRLELGKSRREAELAATERDRLRRLRAEGLATESEVQSAIGAAATAAAARDSLVARFGSDEIQTLRAPRDGIVDSMTAQPGDVLASGAGAAKISAPEALQVRLGVESGDLGRIAIGQAVSLTPLAPGAPTVLAAVAGTDRRIDPQTRRVAALVSIPPNSGLLPGAMLRAEVIISRHDAVVTVPRAALLFAGEQAYAFVVVGNKAQRRNIKTGLLDGESVEIADGLNAGDSVVIAGNSVLEDGMSVRLQSGDKSEAPDTDEKP